jgi:hypothetical protein
MLLPSELDEPLMPFLLGNGSQQLLHSVTPTEHGSLGTLRFHPRDGCRGRE